MDDNKILAEIIQRCIAKGDKKYLACEAAFQIAKELDVSVSIIGLLCNQHSIKIKSCQIGCF